MALDYFKGNGGTVKGIFKSAKTTDVSEIAKTNIDMATDILLQVLTTAAVIAIIYAGFLYIFSIKNEDYKDKANKVLIFTFAGIAIATLALGIMNFTQKKIGDISGVETSRVNNLFDDALNGDPVSQWLKKNNMSFDGVTLKKNGNFVAIESEDDCHSSLTFNEDMAKSIRDDYLFLMNTSKSCLFKIDGSGQLIRSPSPIAGIIRCLEPSKLCLNKLNATNLPPIKL